jgi:hypothetical protein
MAYRTDGLTCDCEAAMLGGDPVFLLRTAYWYAQSLLELDPEPEPPASAAPVVCFRCRGAASGCPVCHGASVAALPDQAAALRLAAA